MPTFCCPRARENVEARFYPGLNCITGASPCGVCHIAGDRGGKLESRIDGGKHNGVEQVRELLRQRAFRAAIALQIYIIDEGAMLTSLHSTPC